MTNTVSINNIGKGQWKMKTEKGMSPGKQTTLTQTGFGGRWRGASKYYSCCKSRSNFRCTLLFQKVSISKPKNDEKYGDIFVDTNKSFEHFKKWNQWALDKEKHPQNLRRPLWMGRPLTPKEDQFYINKEKVKE